MKNKIDKLDIDIINYLQDDARKSLKKLADDLEKKTSTIYHRLQRLKSNNVILGYSVVINPEFLNIQRTSLVTVKIKPLNINSLDDMFIKSFANFIHKEFPNVLFIALSESSRTIHLISIAMSDEAHKEFIGELQNNPYIESIEAEALSSIVKGQKLFSFNERWVKQEKKATAESSDEMEEEAKAEAKERTFEVGYGEGEEMEEELKF